MQLYKQQNKHTNYILTVIDVFSKYAWAIPIKRKTGEEVTKAFKYIFKERKPEYIQSDKGLEFINKQTQKLFENNDIKWFATENVTKAQIAERFNRSLKTKMWRYFTANNTRKWIDVLPKLVYNYNNSYHRSIKMTPTEASLEKNRDTVFKNLYPKKQLNPTKPKFKVGDTVRITRAEEVFRKGYLPNFTTEIFKISEMKNTVPYTYVIEDLDGEKIIGSFYEPEMVKYSKKDEVFKIEKIIRRKGNKLFVKWEGYPEKFNSWIDKKDLVNLK